MLNYLLCSNMWSVLDYLMFAILCLYVVVIAGIKVEVQRVQQGRGRLLRDAFVQHQLGGRRMRLVHRRRTIRRGLDLGCYVRSVSLLL